MPVNEFLEDYTFLPKLDYLNKKYVGFDYSEQIRYFHFYQLLTFSKFETVTFSKKMRSGPQKEEKGKK
jgi:hypothetical protein